MAVSRISLKYNHDPDAYSKFNSLLANTLQLYITMPFHSITSEGMDYHVPAGHEVRLFLRIEKLQRVPVAHDMVCVKEPFAFEEYDVSLMRVTRLTGNLQVGAQD